MGNSDVLRVSPLLRVAIVLMIAAVAIGVRTLSASGVVPPNVEAISAAGLVSAALLPRTLAWMVPVFVTVGTDLVIGNSAILIFTWSAWIASGAFYLLRPELSERGSASRATAMAVVSSLWFFAWTNFGVWFVGQPAMYPTTMSGLVDCYVAGLPFLRNMLVGDVLIVPLVWLAATAGLRLAARRAERFTVSSSLHRFS